MIVNIRFCGGCNPRYDRGLAARRLQDSFPDLEYVINAETPTDLVIFFCGCNAACAASMEDHKNPDTFILRDIDKWCALQSFILECSHKKEQNVCSTHSHVSTILK